MHENSYQQMALMLDRLNPKLPLRVLDIGSYDVNGTYRPLIDLRQNWKYIGMDLSSGPNVDLVVEDPYCFDRPEPIGHYDVIISGNCMEHVAMPWLWVLQVYDHLRNGGVFINITPFSIGYHPYPVDCWRVLPDGNSALFGEWLARQGRAPFQALENYQSPGYLNDVVFMGQKLESGKEIEIQPLLSAEELVARHPWRFAAQAEPSGTPPVLQGTD